MPDLLEAIEENLHQHVAYVQRRVAGMVVDDRKDLLVVDSGLQTDTFNKILRARLNEATADRRIDEALGYFRANGRPFAWWIGPSCRPTDLGRRLERRGLQVAETEQGMAMDLTALPESVPLPEGFTVRRVTSAKALEDFILVLAGDLPEAAIAEYFRQAGPLVFQPDCPMQFYTGYVDGVAAASAELFLSGDVAGLHMVATREQFQRRGIGLAMTWFTAGEGLRQGAQIASLQATELGQRVYARLGFSVCCEFIEYR